MKRWVLTNVSVIPLLAITLFGCMGTSSHVRKVTKPIDETAESLVKVRELKGESGETRAIVSPADERQVRVPF
ncbi:MAG: hypothetical protein A3G87_03360 [Omnitrophica bacterium RIFCSPLOWO2_12_FULL_50_11]|nr:MAG: hypothetical protein A3G87_03360 [Omnitrophica bacterium RIFCSPLOWO2_12_FULL_50_11]